MLYSHFWDTLVKNNSTETIMQKESYRKRQSHNLEIRVV